jgi:hypothetical protein
MIFQFHANSVGEDTTHVTTNPCNNHPPSPLHNILGENIGKNWPKLKETVKKSVGLFAKL